MARVLRTTVHADLSDLVRAYYPIHSAHMSHAYSLNKSAWKYALAEPPAVNLPLLMFKVSHLSAGIFHSVAHIVAQKLLTNPRNIPTRHHSSKMPSTFSSNIVLAFSGTIVTIYAP